MTISIAVLIIIPALEVLFSSSYLIIRFTNLLLLSSRSNLIFIYLFSYNCLAVQVLGSILL